MTKEVQKQAVVEAIYQQYLSDKKLAMTALNASLEREVINPEEVRENLDNLALADLSVKNIETYFLKKDAGNKG